jgi:aminopeptidase N
MGDEAFFAFMRDYYATYQWQMATAADFFSIVRRHTDQDITPLLQTYFVHTTP